MPLVSNSLRTLSAALIAAALIIAALVVGREILVPLALAGIACFILVPAVRLLKRLSFPEGAAVASVVVVVTALLVAGSIALSSQLLSLAAELPAYRTNVLEKVHSVVGSSTPSGLVARAIDAVDSYRDMLDRELKLGTAPAQPAILTTPGKEPKEKVVVADSQSDGAAMLSVVAGPLAQVALTFLFTLFLLLQYKDLRDRIVRVFGTENMTETTAAMSDAGDRLTDLFTGQVILNASFGFVVGCVLAVLGVPNALLWGCVAFVMRFVPFVGSYIAAIPPILLAAAVDPGWTKAICALALFVIGEPIMGQLIEPFFLGKRAGLSPFAMVLATSFWTITWGAVGLVLAAPLTLMLVVLGRYIPNLEFVSVLLGDEPPLSPQQDLYHRLLSGDHHAAVKQIEEAEKSSTPEATLDLVVFPALELAARDRRRGRLDSEFVRELDETIDELVESLGYEENPPEASLLFVPARGSFDERAARFAAGVINGRHPGRARVANASGLTALGSLEDHGIREIGQVVFLTVVGISEKLVTFLAKKGEERFPQARIVFIDLTRPPGDILHNSADRRVELFSRLADFTPSLGETAAAQTPRPTQQVIDLTSALAQRNQT
jgi:predicted PurR-regulated permease PerM